MKNPQNPGESHEQDFTPATYRIQIDETVLNIPGPQSTGRDLLQRVGKDPQTHFLVQIIVGQDDIVVEADDDVDFTQAGVEKLAVVAKGKQFVIYIDETRYLLTVPDPTGRDLLTLAGKDLNKYALVQVIPHGDDRFVHLDEKTNLRPVGIEHFITVLKDEGCDSPRITVKVNKKPVTFSTPTATGLQIKEQAIKQGVKIQTDFLLFDDTSNTMTAIGDEQTVKLFCGQVFLATAPDDNS